MCWAKDATALWDVLPSVDLQYDKHGDELHREEANKASEF